MGKQMSKILPGIYIGRLENAQDDTDMMGNGITHYLSVHEPVEQKLIKSNSYRYLEVNVKDNDVAQISKHFSKTNDFIHEARMTNGNVLILSLAGISRAPTIVLAYMMTVYDLGFDDAFNCLRSVRPNIQPNNGFIRQLKNFDKTAKSCERERLFNQFGVWADIEGDKKLIEKHLKESRRQDMNDSYESCNSPLRTPIATNIVSDEIFDQSEEIFDLELKEIEPQRSGCDSSSETDDDIDIPGSIPITVKQSQQMSMFGQSGLSRQSNPLYSSSATYGSTAPPSLPLYFQKSSK